MHIGYYNPAELKLPDGTLEICTDYPLEGRVFLRLNGCLPSNQLALFIPEYAECFQIKVNDCEVSSVKENGFAKITVPSNAVIELVFDIPLLVEQADKPFRQGYFTLSHGLQMLGVSSSKVHEVNPSALHMVKPGIYEGSGVTLRPITDSYKLNQESMLAERLQILFQKPFNAEKDVVNR